MKQVILVRKDLKMSAGKVGAQTSHASVEAVLRSDKEKVKRWRLNGMKKVVLAVRGRGELLDYKERAELFDLKVALVSDAGRTEVKPGELTCLAIGPDSEEKVDKVTSELKMY